MTGAGSAALETPQEFRACVRAWLDANAPRKGAPGDFSAVHIVSATTPEEYRAREHEALAVTRQWQRRLFDAGFAGRSWPREYGGLDAPSWHDDIVAEEQARYGVSTKMLAVALEMVPPVLFEHGTREQRARHLPRVLPGDETWCQLLSEPGAGSDLGSVSTRVDRVPGGWSVTGQKVWTSGAASADFAVLLARSDRSVRGRGGLSCFVVDMAAEGIDVRPLRQMTGAYHFNEVFLDEVFVPDDALIGPLAGGWRVLRTMLRAERAAIGGGTSARSAVELVALAKKLERSRDPIVRQLVASAYTRERVLDLLQSRVAAGAIPAGGSITKLLYSEHARLTADTAMGILGAAGMVTDHPDAAPWVERFLFAPGLRIGGGTDEIQLSTIAERGLGLPREPRTT